MPDDLPPASVQDTLGNAGTLPTVEWKGETYHLSFPSQKTKTALEEHVAAQAVNECRAMKGVLPADAYAELWDKTVKAIQTRAHRTMGPLWVETIMAGGIKTAVPIMLILFRVRHPKLSEDDVRAMILDEPELTTAALMRVIPSFFEMAVRAVGAPPETAAELMAQLTASLAGLSPPPSG